MDNLNKGNGEYFGPEDELPEEEKNKAILRAKEVLVESDAFNEDLNLEKDPEFMREDGQEYCLVSFIGPYENLNAKHEDLQIAIRGCGTEEMIKKKALELDKKYNIYIFEMYSWIYTPPSLEYMSNPKLHDEMLNKIICKHKMEFEVSKQLFEKRKELMMNTGTDEGTEEVTEEQTEEVLEEIGEINKYINENIINQNVLDSNKINLEEIGSQTEFDPSEKLDGPSGMENYALITIIGGEDLGWAVKINGIYDNLEKANEKMKDLNEVNNIFENYVVECGRWLPITVNPEDIKEKVYINDKYGDRINTLYREHEIQNKKVSKQLLERPE